MSRQENIVCPCCGKSFVSKRKGSRFCSRICAISYNKEKGVYVKSEETREKIRQSCLNKTPWNKGYKMTEDQINKMKASVKAAWTVEKREQQRQKQKEVWSNPELLAKHSKIMIESHSSTEVRQKISVCTKEAMQRDDVKQHMHESFNNPEVLEKRKATNQKRYGCNWIVQHPMYTKAEFKNKTNQDWYNFLYTPELIREFPLDSYVYDFKLNNILIEINPTYTHNSTEDPWYNINGQNRYIKDKNYHKQKTLTAEANGYTCIHVWDWDDRYKIKNLLVPVKYKVSGHKCKIKEITKEIADVFLDKYHLQGSCNDVEVALGLYYQDTLVAVSTYGKSRYNIHYEKEWLRFANNNEYLVQGGAAHKLHNYYISVYKPNSIISYCDRSKFNGKMFTHLDYDLLNAGSPTCHYCLQNNRKQTNDKGQELPKHIRQSLVNKLGACKVLKIDQIDRATGKDNRDIMLDYGYVEVWDCGQASYTWKKPLR